MSTKALIAVRSGSMRVPNKNIRPFSNSNLLEIKIKQLLEVKNLDGIIVNSNDDEILEIARPFDVELVKRDNYFASNEVSMSEVYKDMAANCDCETIVYSNVTNPLFKKETIEKMIEAYHEGGDFDSINSSHAIKEFLFLDNRPMNYQLNFQPRSQDLPNIQALNFAISILPKKLMVENTNVVGRKPFLYQVSELESLDIDSQLDFDIAEFLYDRSKA